jgi:hypothetical protein
MLVVLSTVFVAYVKEDARLNNVLVKRIKSFARQSVIKIVAVVTI